MNSTTNNDSKGYIIVAEDLYIPWDVVFLPNGNMLVSERGGSIMLVADGHLKRVHHVTSISKRDDGLHGMTLHPDFARNRWVYVYYTYYSYPELTAKNKVERFVYDNERFYRSDCHYR